MGETKRRVIPICVDYICDKCGEGRMRPGNTYLPTYPVQYPHECDRCGNVQTFLCKYPRIEYEETEE